MSFDCAWAEEQRVSRLLVRSAINDRPGYACFLRSQLRPRRPLKLMKLSWGRAACCSQLGHCPL